MERELKRFGVSMESGLLSKFDQYIGEHGYTNRSEAIRDLVRRALVEEEWAHDRETVGAITMVYDHHVPGLTGKINRIQHSFKGRVIASMHVHLDRDHCMEVIVTRGRARQVKKLADSLISIRGVLHGTLTGSTVGEPFRFAGGEASGAEHTHSH